MNQPASTELREIAKNIFYHYWDNWAKRGRTNRQKRKDLLEDYETAAGALSKADSTLSSKQASELLNVYIRAAKKYFDLERVYSGSNRLEKLDEEEAEVRSLVDSLKSKTGACCMVVTVTARADDHR